MFPFFSSLSTFSISLLLVNQYIKVVYMHRRLKVSGRISIDTKTTQCSYSFDLLHFEL